MKISDYSNIGGAQRSASNDTFRIIFVGLCVIAKRFNFIIIIKIIIF